MEPVRLTGLDLRDDPVYHRRAARVGRWGRVGLAVLIGAAALGLFGGAGPLVSTDVSAGGLSVRYDRFARLDAPLRLAVGLPGEATREVLLTGDLAGALHVEQASPAPEAERAVARGSALTVRGGSLTLIARPLRFGVLRGEVASGGVAVPVRILVYP